MLFWWTQSASDDVTAAPASGSLSLTGLAVSVGAQIGLSVGTVTTTGWSPAVTIEAGGADVVVDIPLGAYAMTGRDAVLALTIGLA